MGKLNFGATGLSYEIKKPGITQTGAPKCPRCQDRVYFNEEKKAQGKSYHRRCFTCRSCKKSLDSTNYNEHEDDLYCTACHRKQFGPKGYGFAGGAAGLSANQTTINQPAPSFASTSLSSSAEALFNRDNPAGTQAATNGAAAAAGVTIDHNDPERCPRCTKRVYFAEEVKVQRRKYHKLCFKCQSCNKLLEPSKFNVHDDQLYCQPCYGRAFGPKGYGFSGGCGTMLAAETKPHPLSNRTNAETTYVERVDDPRLVKGPMPHVQASSQPASSLWTEPVDF